MSYAEESILPNSPDADTTIQLSILIDGTSIPRSKVEATVEIQVGDLFGSAVVDLAQTTESSSINTITEHFSSIMRDDTSTAGRSFLCNSTAIPTAAPISRLSNLPVLATYTTNWSMTLGTSPLSWPSQIAAKMSSFVSAGVVSNSGFPSILISIVIGILQTVVGLHI
ncbi:MAG: hypothetical protein M1840_001468 [Geoglossum simile]|nr:MAG: hypothetical protein M1840_001468 [Geoglossum simile]